MAVQHLGSSEQRQECFPNSSYSNTFRRGGPASLTRHSIYRMRLHEVAWSFASRSPAKLHHKAHEGGWKLSLDPNNRQLTVHYP